MEKPMRVALPIATSPPAAIPLPVLVAAFCLIWSSAFAVSKVALADCPPLLLVSARCLLAGAIMLGAAALSGTQRRPVRRDLMVGALLGVANYALYLGLNYTGITRGVSAGLSALIISANPVLTTLLATACLGEPLTWRRVTGLLLGVGGVAIIVESRMTGGESPLGVTFVIGALIALVGGTILFKRLAPNGGLWIGNGVQNLAGGLALAPFAAAFESISDVVPSWRLLAALAFLVILSSIVAYLLWFHLLTVAGATEASAYHFLMPPLGLFFGWLLLGERIELPDLIGVLPVALGVWLVTRAAPARKETLA
jgi:drug/metabolite transporter (DMT)-like permease